MKIEKESDALNKEYRQNARMMERLVRKGKWSGNKGEPSFLALHKRQGQIIKELEECTGVFYPPATVEDILKENRRIQNDDWWTNRCGGCHNTQPNPISKLTGLCTACERKILGWKMESKK